MSLAKFSPWYLRLFSTILIGTVLSSAFPAVVMFVYTTAFGSCSLILYSAALPNSHLGFYKSFGYPMHQILSSANKDNLTSSFTNLNSFNFFFMTNSSGKDFHCYVE